MKKFTVGSLFSGVGGLCGGFQDEGFEIAWQVELDDAASGVLDHLYPTVQKFKDIRDVGKHNLSPVDVLVGGFPCTDLSLAGSRVGLDGTRSGLFFEMMRVADELRCPWVVFENVPGLLSSFSPCENPPDDLPEDAEWEVEESSDFETVLRSFAIRGYSGCWRILDCQHFGPPQRRERVFGVFTRGVAGAKRAAEVLALASSLSGHSPKGRKAKADVAAPLTSGTPGSGPGCGEDAAPGHLVVCGPVTSGSGSRGHLIGAEDAANNHLVAFGRNNTSGPIDTAGALMGQCGNRLDFETETFVIQDCRVGNKNQNGLGLTAGGPAYTLQANNHMGVAVVNSLTSSTGGADGADASEDGTGHGTPIVAFGCKDSDPCGQGDPSASPTLRSRGEVAIATEFVVRRLMPIECERLMGWEDGTTAIKIKNGIPVAMADAPRYRACGNGVVRPVARYVARRLKKVMEES